MSSPLKIHKFALDRDKLDQMPTDARRTLFLIGHVANELHTLSRLLTLSMADNTDPVLHLYNDARVGTVLRHFIGMTFEGYRAIESSILKSPLGKQCLDLFGPEATKALNRVKSNLADLQLLAAIRNGFSFHMPTWNQIDNAYSKLPHDLDLAYYTGDPRHSSIYSMSNHLMNVGLLELVSEVETIGAENAMLKIIDDVLDKSTALNDLIEHLIITLVKQYDLLAEKRKVVLTVDGTQSMKTFKIPPLLRS